MSAPPSDLPSGGAHSGPAHPAPSSISSSAFGGSPPHEPTDKKYIAKLALAALGVVYGDIGTSPLYAMRECFHGPHAIGINERNVLGILSLILWSLVITISIKYLLYVLRADNKGEGGILALMALVSSRARRRWLRPFVLVCGVFGASLLYGDGMITPAISVLSAVEGLEIAAPELHAWVIPITIVILIGLFAVQRQGTGGLGSVFGPITLVWFLTLGGLGIYRIVGELDVLRAVNPYFAFEFFRVNGGAGFGVLGSVMLVVTGGEALYADLGHFGRKPIRWAWFSIALPGLLLNYFGQGAFLLRHPEGAENPFFLLAPDFLLYPLVGIATFATIIASQAMISGVYSLTRQASMLGLLPRISVRHTSADERGQIYVPAVNWALMLATIGLVLGFRSSSNLAAAYGMAVILTMVITTTLAAIYAVVGFGWSIPRVLAVTLLFSIPEFAFLGATLEKIPHGGWFPLLVGVGLFTLMLTWRRGREILAQRFREQLLPLGDFFELIRVERPARVPGTAVFMTSATDGTPPALLRNFMHNRVVHQHIVLLTFLTVDSARVDEGERCAVEHLEQGFVRVIARYGFMEQPNAPDLLIRAGTMTSVEHTTFFLGRENFIATERPGMAKWRIQLFAAMSRNAQSATKFFGIPPDRVMEIGAQIEL